MTVRQLAQVYEEIVGEPARSRHKQYLIRRILWRVQARAEGDLSERARRRAAELADDAEVRVTPPRRPMTTTSVALPSAKGETADALADRRLPVAGNLVVRQYKGREIRVIVLADGFEYLGQRFRSLSAIGSGRTGCVVRCGQSESAAETRHHLDGDCDWFFGSRLSKVLRCSDAHAHRRQLQPKWRQLRSHRSQWRWPHGLGAGERLHGVATRSPRCRCVEPHGDVRAAQ
ncbi:MAG: DUF2924 domain-containing protein [Planctomycetota bacterium]